jgi:hypothetical protein
MYYYTSIYTGQSLNSDVPRRFSGIRYDITLFLVRWISGLQLPGKILDGKIRHNSNPAPVSRITGWKGLLRHDELEMPLLRRRE